MFFKIEFKIISFNFEKYFSGEELWYCDENNSNYRVGLCWIAPGGGVRKRRAVISFDIGI